MEDVTALRVALDLLHMPSGVRQLRKGPLPSGVQLLLRIAGRDQAAVALAAVAVERSEDEVRDAAAFYIEQILLVPGADCYRTLGAAPDASALELRRNMALLLTWLHPDKDREAERSVFAGRVTSAWDRLKTSERRAAYDIEQARPRTSSQSERRRPALRGSSGGASYRNQEKARTGALIVPLHPYRMRENEALRPAGLIRRTLMLLFGKDRL